MARIICVSNHKGGVGKTTIAANLTFALARHFKVLLIDLDPQANLTLGLGYKDSPENIGKYFKDIIHFRLPTVRPTVINKYVHLIPGTTVLNKINNQLHETTRSEFILKEMLLPLLSSYDLIFIDCPPALNLLTLNALHSCNLILIPAKPELFSINGIEMIKSFADENALPYKVIFNQVNSRSLLHSKVISKAKSKFDGHLMHQNIRNTIVLAEAFEHAKNIFKHKANSNGALDFINLADELLPVL